MAEAVGLAASIGGLATIASEVSKLCHNYISEVVNAEKNVEQLVSEISSLTSLLERFSTPTKAGWVSQALGSSPVSQLVRECTEMSEMLKKLQAELQCQLNEKSDSKLQNIVGSLKARLKWPFKTKDTRERIQKIERLKATFTLALQLDEEHHRRDEEQRRQVEKILEWVSSERCGQRHAHLKSERKPGIGHWLLEAPEFVKWRTGDPCTVLLGRGIAGAGKTYLSSVVIDHLREQPDPGGFGVGHIYFEYQEQKQQTVLSVVASLAKQLLSQIPSTVFPKDIETIYQGKKAHHPSADDLTDILLSMPNRFTHRVFVVCDALDETDQHEREKLLPLFHRLKDSGFALFLTTRPHPVDVQESFQDASIIELSPKIHDIRRYVEERLSANPGFKGIQQASSGLNNRTVSKIVDSAAGIFLLAKFNVDYVFGFRTVGGIEEALLNLSIPEAIVRANDNNIPSERENERRMDSVYNRIVDSIRNLPQAINRKYAFRALSWIGHATRTLTAQELLVAICVEAGQYQLNDKNIYTLESLLDICSGLVVADEDGRAVRLVHYSVRNFLDRNKIIPEDTKETYRAITCSTYLSFDSLREQEQHSLNQVSWELKRNRPFLDYAANNLAFHLSMVDHRHYPETTSAILKLLYDRGHRRTYCIINWKIREDLKIQRLSLACAIGYEDAVRALLKETEVDVNAKDEYGHTPLLWAVRLRHGAVVKCLLDDGRADQNCKNIAGWMPLSLEIETGDEWRILGLLLKKRVEVDFTYKLGRRWLELRREEEWRRELRRDEEREERREELRWEEWERELEWRREWEREEDWEVTPLFHAVLRRREPAVRMLLEKGAKPDFTLEFGALAGESPLSFAEKRCMGGIVELLQSYVQQE